ncbi:MAG: N-acetylmuramoyl-L-alanine amidase [Chloroflexota bacterium]
MASYQSRRQPTGAAAPSWLLLIRRHLATVAFLILAAVGMWVVYSYFSPARGEAEAVLAAGGEGSRLSAAIVKPVPQRPVTQRVPQSPGPLRIGLIAGHAGYDTGTVCEDALTEVQVTQNLAGMVAMSLRTAGIPAEILAEFDSRLNGYSATALISIHVDSCDYYGETATGFKIAGSAYTDSSHLSICMEQAYGGLTQLPFHINTITPEMTDYHAFREIAPGTPAIIIEVGFLNLDRELLTARPEVAAEGVTNGILCFLGR